MFGVSLLPPRTIRRVALVGFLVAIGLVALTFVVGIEIKGARRWINLPGLSLQPSEFVKPTFAVVTGWLLAEGKLREDFPGPLIAALLYVVVIGLLVKQPDLGVAGVLSATGLFVQFGLQAIINMASSLHLMPTKGMTLPFLSYGGSSLLALGLGMGMALALTRRRFGGVDG